MVLDDMNEHIPPLYRDITDLKSFHNSLNFETNQINLSLNDLLKNTVVETANEYFISRWERALKIRKQGDLNDRKNTILFTLQTKTPYSKKQIKEFMDLNASSGWTIEYNHLPEKKEVSVTVDVLSEFALFDVITYFKNVTPLDYGLTFSILYKCWKDYKSVAIWEQLILYSWVETRNGVPYAILKVT